MHQIIYIITGPPFFVGAAWTSYIFFYVSTFFLLFVWHRATNGISPLLADLFCVHDKGASVCFHAIKASTSDIHLHHFTWKRRRQSPAERFRRLLLAIQSFNLVIHIIVQFPITQCRKARRLQFTQKKPNQ